MSRMKLTSLVAVVIEVEGWLRTEERIMLVHVCCMCLQMALNCGFFTIIITGFILAKVGIRWNLEWRSLRFWL